MSSIDTSPLRVLALVRAEEPRRLLERVLTETGDQLSVVTDRAGALARASESPDFVLVERGVGEVARELRARLPHVVLRSLPLEEDELRAALASIQREREGRRRREELERESQMAKLASEIFDALDAVGECSSRREAARRALGVFVQSSAARRAAVFLRGSADARGLLLTEQLGELPGLPTFCDELALMQYASDHAHVEVVRLAGRATQQGVLLLCDVPAWSPALAATFERAGAHAATLVALGAEREAARGGSMKDPASSAYSPAFFLDVAGREIDRARRHGRRLALAALTAAPGARGGAEAAALAEHALLAVRDTDILARVDEREFYLLLPETGGLGAHACRRRMMEHYRSAAPAEHLAVGIATFPHDGAELSALMRVARRRADASRRSFAFGPELAALDIDHVLERMLGVAKHAPAAHALCALELSRADLAHLATTAIREARRSGSVWAAATSRPGLSLSAAARAALGPPSEETRLECVDAELFSPGGAVEAFTLVTEHGAYTLLGRLEDEVVRAVHSDDPLLGDFLVDRLGAVAEARLWSP